MTYNVFSGTLNPAQSGRLQHGVHVNTANATRHGAHAMEPIMGKHDVIT